MIPNWWVQLLPNHYQLEIEEAMEIITERSHDYALRREKMN